MRILLVADAGSPIARSWIGHLAGAGHEVHVVSSYPVDDNVVAGAASTFVVPVAFSSVSPRFDVVRSKGYVLTSIRGALNRARRVLPLAPLARLRNALAPADVFRLAPRLRRQVRQIAPDVVHAMRLPYEGYLAAEALRGDPTPLIVSIWGNDFTLHADGSRILAAMTRRALARTDALHSDCHRDVRLAHKWGLAADKPTLVLPGNGGLDLHIFCPGAPASRIREILSIPRDAPVVVNPRGVRTYVRNETFFRALPRVLAVNPRVVFVGVGMANDPELARIVGATGVSESVRLTPPLARDALRDLFRVAIASVSPSQHDGTPNSLLEAMACGAVPIAGDIESVREWVVDGENGLLFDPVDPVSLSNAVVRAVDDAAFCVRAAKRNSSIIADRAGAAASLPRVEAFYLLAQRRKQRTGAIDGRA